MKAEKNMPTITFHLKKITLDLYVKIPNKRYKWCVN